MNRIFTTSRYLILIAVGGSMVMSIALILYGGFESIQLVIAIFTLGAKMGSKEIAVMAIKVVDILLIGTVIYIIGLGLYELFVDDQIKVPGWLEIHSLDDLKHKLIGVLVVVMSVFFLEKLVGWDGEQNLINLGVPIASIIAALGFFLSQKEKT